MAEKHRVTLTIHVPDDVEVYPVIVRKGGTVGQKVTGLMKNATLDLTTAKTGKWLGGKLTPFGDNCCCVRG